MNPYVWFQLGLGWEKKSASGGMMAGLICMVGGLLSLADVAEQPTRYSQTAAAERAAAATAHAPSSRKTRVETRTHADGSTYTIKVEDTRPHAGPPVDPMLPAVAVGLGTAMMGVCGTFLLFGGAIREEKPVAPAPPSPRFDGGAPVVFTDEDVQRAMNELTENPRE